MGGVEEAGRNREGERLSQNLTSKRGGLLEGGSLIERGCFKEVLWYNSGSTSCDC